MREEMVDVPAITQTVLSGVILGIGGRIAHYLRNIGQELQLMRTAMAVTQEKVSGHGMTLEKHDERIRELELRP